jgi:hypothetical protein
LAAFLNTPIVQTGLALARSGDKFAMNATRSGRASDESNAPEAQQVPQTS